MLEINIQVLAKSNQLHIPTDESESIRGEPEPLHQ